MKTVSTMLSIISLGFCIIAVCATNASGAWVTSTIDSAGNVGSNTSIAIDSNNKVHIRAIMIPPTITSNMPRIVLPKQ